MVFFRTSCRLALDCFNATNDQTPQRTHPNSRPMGDTATGGKRKEIETPACRFSKSPSIRAYNVRSGLSEDQGACGQGTPTTGLAKTVKLKTKNISNWDNSVNEF